MCTHTQVPPLRLLRQPHPADGPASDAANLRTRILDFGGFDSSRILSLRGGIPTSMGSFLGILGQRILVGMILVGRLGVLIHIQPHTRLARIADCAPYLP